MNRILGQHALINGNRIAYGVHGQGAPVVLLHGTPSSSLIWRNVLPQLVASGYRVHVYDLLGYGASERPAAPAVDTSISAQVPILEALLAHWQLDTIHLVGHDFGGGIVQRFGVFKPGRLRSLTLMDTVSFDSSPSQRTKEQLEAGLETLIKTPDAAHRAHFRDWLLSAVWNKPAFADDVLSSYVEMISGPVGQGSYFQHQARTYEARHTMEIADRLHELAALPVKIIWGAEDAWQSVDCGERLQRAIPGSELSVVEEAGHFAPEDQPVRIAELLVDFFDRVRPPGT
ncbi:alpha/beta fold hydrolase [Pseudodonghicola xiamenensis]|uniref:Oxidoreductase n=1 Tax=Pseudodonghicola xiamenensis TaxID=337702 RepID=A0A8J3H9L0_9RHOB|nr:alpha/beta hydrolase [Pseudodonghicola xiamenensis]GHG92803.1 oxidoreductase [Pseudodonghicola xiamenensis]